MVVIKIYDLKMVRGDTSYIYWIFNFLKCTDYMTVSLFNVSIIRCFIKLDTLSTKEASGDSDTG